MNLKEEKIRSNLIYSGKIFNVYRDEVMLPNGKLAYREAVDHNGAVAIVPLDKDEVILIRQFRYSTGEEILEIPAGTLNKGEDPESCARRELEEEIGYTAGKIKKMTEFFLAPGYSNELLHLFIAWDLSRSSQILDGDEFVQIERYPKENVIELVMNRKVRDAKTIIGLYMLMDYMGVC
jgi:ADP-ribose pyrophosphatase